jgi:hypothetical protein
MNETKVTFSSACVCLNSGSLNGRWGVDQERAVQTYRIFGVNASGDVVSEDDVQCVNDTEARAAAKARMREGVDVEIWDVSRRVPKHGERAPRQRLQRAI